MTFRMAVEDWIDGGNPISFMAFYAYVKETWTPGPAYPGEVEHKKMLRRVWNQVIKDRRLTERNLQLSLF